MTLFINNPTPIAAPSLGTIAPDDISYFSEFERDAAGHWIFDRDEKSLNDLGSGVTLAAQGIAPVFRPKYLTLSSAKGNALLTPFTEIVNQVDTMWAVVRNTSPIAFQPFMGSIAESGGANTGSSLFMNFDSDVYSWAQGVYNVSLLSRTFTPGSWMFMCYTRNFVTPTSAAVLIGGQADVTIGPPAGTPYRPTAGNIGMGNPYYTPGGVGTYDFAEFGVINAAYSATQRVDLFARSVARMAKRGITVVT